MPYNEYFEGEEKDMEVRNSNDYDGTVRLSVFSNDHSDSDLVRLKATKSSSVDGACKNFSSTENYLRPSYQTST